MIPNNFLRIHRKIFLRLSVFLEVFVFHKRKRKCNRSSVCSDTNRPLSSFYFFKVNRTDIFGICLIYQNDRINLMLQQIQLFDIDKFVYRKEHRTVS